MNKTLVTFALCMALLCTACNGKKDRAANSSQLIENVAQLGIDAVEAVPGDTLCNTTVDEVLRHYPELYHATKKAKKAYDVWVASSKDSRLKVKPATMDVSTILDETLFGSETIDADSVWQYLPTIDSLYIQAIVSIESGKPDTDQRKTAIGRMRKAWQAYVGQLQAMGSAIPEDCRQRYFSTVRSRTRQLTNRLLYVSNK